VTCSVSFLRAGREARPGMADNATADAARGAYGFRLTGNAPASSLLTPVGADAPAIKIIQTTGTKQVENIVERDWATVPLLGDGSLELDREDLTATLTIPEPLTDDELAHPYLAPIAAVHSHWLDRAPFHAGGIVVAGRAWGVIGERGAGKSTLLAAVAAAGYPVLADDLLVVDGPIAYAGPRTLDLRSEAVAWFSGTRNLEVAGARRRWRLDLAESPQSAPLAGWILPGWAEELRIDHYAGAAAVHHLAPARSVKGLAINPEAFIAAVALPAVEFLRPHDMSQLQHGVALLLSNLEEIL